MVHTHGTKRETGVAQKRERYSMTQKMYLVFLGAFLVFVLGVVSFVDFQQLLIGQIEHFCAYIM
jgi:cytochrome c biogenesis protein CcdA